MVGPVAFGGRGQRGGVNSTIEGWPGRLRKKLNTLATYVVAFVLSLLHGAPSKLLLSPGRCPRPERGPHLPPRSSAGSTPPGSRRPAARPGSPGARSGSTAGPPGALPRTLRSHSSQAPSVPEGGAGRP